MLAFLFNTLPSYSSLHVGWITTALEQHHVHTRVRQTNAAWNGVHIEITSVLFILSFVYGIQRSIISRFVYYLLTTVFPAGEQANYQFPLLLLLFFDDDYYYDRKKITITTPGFFFPFFCDGETSTGRGRLLFSFIFHISRFFFFFFSTLPFTTLVTNFKTSGCRLDVRKENGC